MPEVSLNGWKIGYRAEGQGPPVLFVHGFLMDRTMFDPQVESLGDRYRFITPDLKCHGETEVRAEAHTQWDMVEDHVTLLDHLGIERAVWGGVSQGGFQSLRAALKYPERVAALVLIDTQAGPEDEIRAPMYEAFAQVVASEGWNEDVVQTAAISMFGSSAGEELKKFWIDKWVSRPSHASVEMIQSVTRREDITDRLGEIAAPAIVIHGEEDLAIEMERGEALANGLPNLIEFVKIPGAGHSSTVEQPQAVTEAIERFLSKVYPPA